ncbi:hypothetical protein HBI71_143270 [Parastagonospora nodorum]|nr:hypothetical protein HBI71_143270 [Parastagonospora nodorum]
MGFDCYCALCSGPLGIYSIKLGSAKLKHLAKRRKRVENKRRRLRGEDVVHEDSKEWKEAEKREFGGDEDLIEGHGGGDGVEEGGGGGNGENDGEGNLEEGHEGMMELSFGSGDGGGDNGGNDWDEGVGDMEGTVGDDVEEMEEIIEETLEEGSQDGGSDQGSASADENENDDDDDDEADLEDDESLASDEDFSDHWSQASELQQRGFTFRDSTEDETSSMFSYYEKQSYDPGKLSREDVQWLDRSRVLALNRELEGRKKAFLSGRGRYNDYFDFKVQSLGPDPRDTDESTHCTYHAYEPEKEVPSFPVHEACFKILTECFATEKRQKVDKDVLYAVMQQNMESMARKLSLDYGTIEGADQFWECIAGEEWVAMDPATKPGIEDVVKSMLPAQLFDRPAAQSRSLAHKVCDDPLATLPYDVLHGVFAHLSLKDTLSLMKASWHVLESTRDATFWRLMIRVHITDFFWELKELFKTTTFPETFDWKGMFQWLDQTTRGSFAMEGPMMAIANRRRIWNVCQQLAPLYYEKLEAEAYIDPPDADAEAIMMNAKVYHSAVTMFPIPAETRPATTQFIRSWSEISYRACDFDTYWSGEYGHLIGISVDFGSEKRVFGSTEGAPGQSLHIAAEDWIKEIMVSSRPIHERGKFDRENGEDVGPKDARSAGPSMIQGMDVYLSSGARKSVHPGNNGTNNRSFAVLPGMHIIGLTGEFSHNGGISKLGLLQAPDPALPPPPSSLCYSPFQTYLWTGSGENTWRSITGGEPVWSHPHFTVFTFPAPTFAIEPAFLHPDDLPHSVLLFAAQDPSGYSRLQRISAIQIPDEHSNESIIGLAAFQPDTRWNPPGVPRAKHGHNWHIGSKGPVSAMMGEKWSEVETFEDLKLWDSIEHYAEEYMRHFDIDGAGGEVVVEVHVTKDRRSLRLVTNRRREGQFGEKSEGKEWEDGKVAGEGEMIIGVTACFGRLSGWSPTAKMWSHWGMTDLGVVLTKTERK